MSDDRTLLVLDGQDGDAEAAMVERRPNRTWVWGLIVVAVVVVAVGIGGAILDTGDDEPTESAPATTAAPTTTAPPTTAAPADNFASTPLDNLAQQRPDPLPVRIAPFEAPPDLVIVGHSAGLQLGAVRGNGTVSEYLVGDGLRFFPITSDGSSLLGVLAGGGGTVAILADGTGSAVLTDSRDAPIYLPRHGGNGYVVHGTWLGQVHYIDSTGQRIAEGPELARGTSVLADAEPGLVVLTLDGNALIVDRTDGTVLGRLPTVPVAIGGNRQVVVTCRDAIDCTVELQNLDGTTVLVLDIEPELVNRLVIGISPDGRFVAHRSGGAVRVVDDTNTEIVRFEGDQPDLVAWLDDAIAYGDSEGVQLFQLGDDGPALLPVGRIIDPTSRGFTLLRN